MLVIPMDSTDCKSDNKFAEPLVPRSIMIDSECDEPEPALNECHYASFDCSLQLELLVLGPNARPAEWRKKIRTAFVSSQDWRG